MTSPILEISDLHATIEGKRVLRGVTLTLRKGELHVLMGPNGSGKSSLAFAILGHPRYTVTKGDIRFDGRSLLHLKPHERARRGVFLSFQHPVAIPGVSVANLVRMSSKQFHGTRRGDAASFRERLRTTADSLKLDPAFVERSVNDGFSGGEKKQSEILQMAVLEPQLAILDEPDSGLDIDALKRTAQVMNGARTDERTFLVITHYERLLQHIRADAVHIMLDGRIVRTGDATLATELERSGYQPVSASAR